MSLKYLKRFALNQTDVDVSEEEGTLLYTQDAIYGTVSYFDGSTSLSSETIDQVTGTGDRTITFWANVESFQAPIISYGNFVSPEAFVVYIGDSSGTITFSDFSSDTISNIITPVDVWRFYTISYSSGSMKIYIDGVLQDTLDVGGIDTGTSGLMRVGTDGAGSYLSGFVLDIRIYDTEVDEELAQYMYSRGPNYEEPAGFDFAESMTTLGTGVHGTVLCRDMYSIKNTGTDSISSLFARDGDNNIVESARYTHTNDSIKASVKTTNSDGVSYMTSVIDSTPEKTSFFVTESDDSRKSVVFSSEGVKIISDSPYGLYFGEDKDFRMVFEEGSVDNNTVDSWKIQALDETSGLYVTKLEIGS